MLYLQQTFDIHPASPATRDRFVDIASGDVVPASARAGGRLVAAFFCHEEWFSQIRHVVELDDLAAFAAWRTDAAAARAVDRLGALCASRRDELLEPLGPVAPEALQSAIDASTREPAKVYTYAILEVVPGAMPRFAAALGAAASVLPIVASWRDVAGNPARVIDLWKGDVGRQGYRPTDDQQNGFFEPLREMAPRERMLRLHPLPYSPLQ